MVVESIQETGRQSFKIGRGDEQKLLMQFVSILISDLQKYHLSQTMVSSNRYVGRLRIPSIDSRTGANHVTNTFVVGFA